MKISRPSEMVFLKLGGSLITDKAKPQTARSKLVNQLASEIKSAQTHVNHTPLVLGHGSGSFGHVPARKFGTRQGVVLPDEWRGFAEVWYEASSLNRIVMEALHTAEIPAISFPVSGTVSTREGKVVDWNLNPLMQALQVGLLPVVYGDVVFDQKWGGTILSTEEIFSYLAQEFRPSRILLAGNDQGVWADFPNCTRLIPVIDRKNWAVVESALGGSAATDVTGGMRSKVSAMFDLVTAIPGLEVNIFSGEQPGNLFAALRGESIGTRITR
jgi:isopentenyl phosphate kinase